MSISRNLIAASAALASLLACNDSGTPAGGQGPSQSITAGHHGASHGTQADAARTQEDEAAVEVEVFAPEDGDRVGLDGVGWFIDIAVVFPKTAGLPATGFKGNQLTGPGAHANVPPFAGSWGVGKDDRFPGLVVLESTFVGGSCANIANTFNLTGVTNRNDEEIEIWDTYIVGAPVYGRHTSSSMFIAEVADLDHNGVHDDAPDLVPDSNHDGVCDATDLEALGIDSEVATKTFQIL